MLRYLSRYTHRVAISNRRLMAADDTGVAFRWKDYRIDGPGRWKTMPLHPHEFIRRFLMHVLPKGFHRIRHYGLFAGTAKAEHIATARKLLDMPAPDVAAAAEGGNTDANDTLNRKCPCCGGPMRIIERFKRGETPRYHPSSVRHSPDRHVMTETCGQLGGFLAIIRWRRAGDDLSRPNHGDQRPGRPLMACKAVSKRQRVLPTARAGRQAARILPPSRRP